MKTEVKFRELPEKVQGFLIRMFGYSDDSNPTIKLEWLHNLPEWSEATDDERLAYAEGRYPVGVVCKRIDSECTFTICDPNGRPMFFDELNVEQIKDEEWYNQSGKYLSSNPPIYKDGKWADIISEPDEVDNRKESNSKSGHSMDDFLEICQTQDKSMCPIELKEASPEAQEEFVKANPGMQHVEEPKAGDMVEARIDGWPETEWRNRKYLCKNSFGKFVCEYKDGSVERFDEIRLPQKSEVESKAKELWEKPGNEDLHAWEIVMQGIKWGQANPGKI